MPVESRGSAALQRPIPKTGEPIPAIGLGTWQVFDIAGDRSAMVEAKDTLKLFVEQGGRVVDSSPMYGSSEAVTGQIAAATVIVSGEVHGNIAAGQRVELLETGIINGDVKAAVLTVAAGSRMRGNADFGWTDKHPK